MKHTKQWFLKRTGKKIYRKKLDCPCASCQKTDILIRDADHADYIWTCQLELGIEYFDKPKTY